MTNACWLACKPVNCAFKSVTKAAKSASSNSLKSFFIAKSRSDKFVFCLSSKFNLAPTSPLKLAIWTCVSAILLSCAEVNWLLSYRVW